MEILFWTSFFIAFEAMIGYPATLIAIEKIQKPGDNKKNEKYEPTVTLMIVAHNEEKVILKKLNNAISVNYPKKKLQILVASDFSTDKTDELVEEFIAEHKDFNIRLYRTANHYGKTNAQNEAQKLVRTEILVMSDANAMLERNAMKELVSSFSDDSIAYVSGQLKYSNTKDNSTAASEGIYWKLDLRCREIESKIQTITAGNGALYAVRNKDYIGIDPMECHDSSFPLIFALDGKRAIYNKDAVAYEKAGEFDKEEFNRKARSNRLILKSIVPDKRVFHIFKNRWFSFFYFGHRTCRYLLWLAHGIALTVNIFLLRKSRFWKGMFAAQALFYAVASLGAITKSKNRGIRMMTYYFITVLAQWKAVLCFVTGRSKATWEKAESTR